MAMRPPVPAPAAGDQGANEVTEPTVSATINKSVLPLRPVPKKSYLPGRDARYEEALASVCLPEDRQRWPVFFREVLLGLAIINAVCFVPCRMGEKKANQLTGPGLRKDY